MRYLVHAVPPSPLERMELAPSLRTLEDWRKKEKSRNAEEGAEILLDGTASFGTMVTHPVVGQ